MECRRSAQALGSLGARGGFWAVFILWLALKRSVAVEVKPGALVSWWEASVGQEDARLALATTARHHVAEAYLSPVRGHMWLGTSSAETIEKRETRALIACTEGARFRTSEGGTLKVREVELRGCGVGTTTGGVLELRSVTVAAHFDRGSAVSCENGEINATDVVLRGNRIFADRSSGAYADGGAAWLGPGCVATFVNATFSENWAGPDPECAPSDGCLSGRGGAVHAFRAAQVRFFDSVFSENAAQAGDAGNDGAQGGALYVSYVGTFTCDGCAFDGNSAAGRVSTTAVLAGGAGDGGAARIAYVAGPVAFKRTTFFSNQATPGAAAPATGGGLSLVLLANFTCEGCILEANAALGSAADSGGLGGGVSVLASVASFRASTFLANSAHGPRDDVARRLSETFGADDRRASDEAFDRWRRMVESAGGRGGGAFATAGAGAVTFEDSVFKHNSASRLGHDVFAAEGLSNASTCVRVVNCTLDTTPSVSGGETTIAFPDDGPLMAFLTAVSMARIAAVETKLEIESSSGAASSDLEVVVVGGASLDRIRSCTDLANDSGAVGEPRNAAVRLVSTTAHAAPNASLGVLALWADVILGDANRTAEVALSRLVIIGGALAAANGGVMTLRQDIVLSDVSVIGDPAAYVEPAPSVSGLHRGDLAAGMPTIRLDGAGVSVVGDVSRVGRRTNESLLRLLGRRPGRVELCGVSLDLVRDATLVLDAAELELRRGAGLKIGSRASLVLYGGQSTLASALEDRAALRLNGTLRRDSSRDTLRLPNATYVHAGVVQYEALTPGSTVADIFADADDDRHENEPVITARKVILASGGLVNATVGRGVLVAGDAVWPLFQAEVFGLLERGDWNGSGTGLLSVPEIAGAGNGVGLRLDFASDVAGSTYDGAYAATRLEDESEKTASLALVAAVDYVDCSHRALGLFAESTSSMPPPPLVDDDDRIFPVTPTSKSEQTEDVSTRKQCGLCLTDNSSCAFSFALARSDEYDAVCTDRAGAETNAIRGASYRSTDCCEDGCGVGGTCVSGRCICTWWWSSKRCTLLSWKARAVIAVGLLVVLGIAAAATYVSLWRRRKSVAIGEALDELRDHLLSDERNSNSFQVGAGAASSFFGGLGLPIPAGQGRTCPSQSRVSGSRDERENSGDEHRTGSADAGLSPQSDGDFAPLRRASSFPRELPQCKPSFLRMLLGGGVAAAGPPPPLRERGRSRSINGASQSFDPSFLRDVRERLVLRDVLVKRTDLVLSDKIGRGAFGDVYRGRYRGCDVAVKKLRLERRLTKASVAEELDRFRAEAVLLSRMRHPNVVMIMGVVVEQNRDASDDSSEDDGTAPRSAAAGGGFGLRFFRAHPRAEPAIRRSPSTEPTMLNDDSPRVAPPPLVTISIVTEFLEAGSLSDLLYDLADFAPCPRARNARPPLPGAVWTLDLLLACALQAARGMTYLHARGVCHRDLKCANLMVDEHWRVKIGDYNLSRFIDADRDRAVSISSPTADVAGGSPDDVGALMTADVGSIRWMAPEIFGAGSKVVKYSLAADVYSFAMCLFEMYVRAPPWPHMTSRFDIADAVIVESLVPDLAVAVNGRTAADPPLAFAQLYTACAHHNPGHRPDFAAVADDIDAQLRALRAAPQSGGVASPTHLYPGKYCHHPSPTPPDRNV